MSHQPERTEKNCLNCGTTVAGRFCQQCGQENIVTRQSIWGLIRHFVYDIFHFDGKFFDTLRFLLTKPGKVPKEYVSGKRMSYLDPIRMYLFTSAVFFLVFFSIPGASDNIVNIDDDDGRTMTKVERLEYATYLHHRINAGDPDTSLRQQLNYLLDSNYRVEVATAKAWAADTAYKIRLDEKEWFMGVSRINRNKEDMEFHVGSSWLDRKMENKWKAYKDKFADDDNAMIKDMAGSFVSKFPYLLFLSLPFFALILKLLYIRRKQFYYSDHAVFTLYHYIFTFLLLLIYFLLQAVYKWLDWGLIRLLSILVFLSGGVYLLIAMKRFYLQRWGKTTIKFLLLNILAFITISILMLLFIILSVFQL